MVECCVRLSPLHFLAVQEASQWDLRSFPLYFLVALLVSVFLVLVPIVQLLRRTGHSPVWCILSVLPVLNLGALWFFAFKPWPTDKKSVATGN
jgi:hypothetical protein